MPCVTKDISLRGACGHRPSSARLQTRPISSQASRRTAPARRSRQATGSRLKLYRGFGQTAFLPNWPWGRSSHVPCSPGDSNRLEGPARIPHKWRLIMAHSHVPYTPGQPGWELLRLPCPRSPAFPSLMFPHLALGEPCLPDLAALAVRRALIGSSPSLQHAWLLRRHAELGPQMSRSVPAPDSQSLLYTLVLSWATRALILYAFPDRPLTGQALSL